jgi:hypothetical protein
MAACSSAAANYIISSSKALDASAAVDEYLSEKYKQSCVSNGSLTT